MKVRVDPLRCQGHTLCAMIAPEMFALSDFDGTSSAICEVVPSDRESAVREAASSCPEQARASRSPTSNHRESNVVSNDARKAVS